MCQSCNHRRGHLSHPFWADCKGSDRNPIAVTVLRAIQLFRFRPSAKWDFIWATATLHNR